MTTTTATVIVLGATGDLTSRYLLPGLAQLLELGTPAGGLRLVGVARDELDEAGFRTHVRAALRERAGQVAEAARDRLADDAHYLTGDVTDPKVIASALRLAGDLGTGPDDPVVLYLALPHVLFPDVIGALQCCEIPAGLRIVVEKPFGSDLAGAQRLNAALGRVFRENRIFRVDHFLAKQTVLNLIGLRFANRILEPLWSNSHIAAVDIVFDETVDAQTRASYYDRAGALRDMVQNHLLQLLTLVAMEPPLTTQPTDLARRKVDVLRAVRPLSPTDVAARTVRGRYTAGTVHGRDGERPVAGYAEAPGVDPARQTETYAEITLFLDNWRWSGVPFRLRTGKALARDRREIIIRFADVPHPVFADRGECNELRLQLDPDRMSLKLNVNGIGDPFDLDPVELDAELATQAPSPYGQLLLAIIEGDTRLSAQAEEAEESWRIVEPVLAAWRDGAVPLLDYPAGSAGPAGAVDRV
ncbi:glucose-6-phosphate dehydrogenase [Solwaraspora sp. WMMD1047]|uniref:glucose-6-phosphate dehydrogenase n=1 Tax=Solwaraspora sp. WMMD1047 TaxID=3016102 RepID=UPI002417E1DD|nr:glucose-6-phosphate dehydrogenase [Solwaraspora sp. WMMD1047]MDG4828316.1 glucose-6-phosphate dehydrogenase [Solwaraspora sp. WMMD1047]